MTKIPDILVPLIFKFNMKRWSDTFAFIVPPKTEFVTVERTPENKAIINYYIKLGRPRIYNPATGTLGDIITSDEVGFFRMSEQVKWHDVPFVESIYDEGYGDMTITGGKQYECTYMVYNYTPHYVYIEGTSFLLEFSIDNLEDVKKYFRGIADFFIRQAEGGDGLWALSRKQST